MCWAFSVTFIDELTRLSDKTVSVASTVAPDNRACQDIQNREKARGWARLRALDRGEIPPDLP